METKLLNFKYWGLMISNSFINVSMTSFGTVYLLGYGFSESQIGIFIAVANILATIFQPLVASQVDRDSKRTLKDYNSMVTLLISLLVISMLFIHYTQATRAIVFMLIFSAAFLITPLLSSVSMYFTNAGYPINFGVGRAMSSLFYAIISPVLGSLVATNGVDMVMYTILFGVIFYTVILWQFPFNRVKNEQNKKVEQSEESFAEYSKEKAAPSVDKFAKKYPKFMLILIGIIFLYTGHKIINQYMFQIVTSRGGTTSQMGIAMSIGALIGVPTMFFYQRARSFINESQLVFLAAFGFFIKSFFTLLAQSVFGVYFAQIFQLIAFGLYVVAIVYFTNEIMETGDKVKGQAYVTACQTLGGVLGSLAGGVLIDYFNINVALAFCVILSFLGLILFFIALKDRLFTKKEQKV